MLQYNVGFAEPLLKVTLGPGESGLAVVDVGGHEFQGCTHVRSNVFME